MDYLTYLGLALKIVLLLALIARISAMADLALIKNLVVLKTKLTGIIRLMSIDYPLTVMQFHYRALILSLSSFFVFHFFNPSL